MNTKIDTEQYMLKEFLDSENIVENVVKFLSKIESNFKISIEYKEYLETFNDERNRIIDLIEEYLTNKLVGFKLGNVKISKENLKNEIKIQFREILIKGDNIKCILSFQFNEANPRTSNKRMHPTRVGIVQVNDNNECISPMYDTFYDISTEPDDRFYNLFIHFLKRYQLRMHYVDMKMLKNT